MTFNDIFGFSEKAKKTHLLKHLIKLNEASDIRYK